MIPPGEKKLERKPFAKSAGIHGQSVWLDYIDRRLIESGGLQRLIDEDGLRGVTKPNIFDKAVEGSDAYDESIRQAARKGLSVEEIYRLITTEDVRNAADLFRPVYDELDGRDGFVSLEVNPHLAHDLRAPWRRPPGSGPPSTTPMFSSRSRRPWRGCNAFASLSPMGLTSTSPCCSG